MWHYPYRWFYAVSVSATIFVSAYIYQIQAEWNRLEYFQAEEMHLNERLSLLQQNAQRKTKMIKQNHWTIIPLKDQASILSDFFALADSYGLTIHSVRNAIQEKNIKQNMVIYFSMSGSFSKMMSFVVSLNSRYFTAYLTHFSLMLDKQYQLILHAEIKLFQGAVLSIVRANVQNQTPIVGSPFCPFSKGTNILSTPLMQIKMRGLLQRGDERQAFVSLPDHALVAVKQGDLLGREHGMLIDISHDHLVVLLPNHHRLMLSM